MQKITQSLWKAFLFTFPFSIHFVLYEKAAYRFGNFNPWVSGFMYLPEILLLLTFAFWGIEKIRQKKVKFRWPTIGEWLMKALFLNAAIVTLLQGDIFLFLFLAIRFVEAYFFYLMLKDELLPHNTTVTWLLYGATFQILLAFFQTRLDHSLGLHIIGEPYINPGVDNVAKIDLTDGSKEIRGYGTFLHPNILGAYLMTILFVTMPYLKKAALPVWIILLTTGIFLTGSLAAQLTTVAMFIFLAKLAYFKKPEYKRYLTLGTLGVFLVANAWFFINSARVAISSASIQERLAQNVISLNMFLNNFFGVGIGNFTLRMEEFAAAKLMPWDFQPVHNVYFLALNETGVQGLIILIAAIAWALHLFWSKKESYNLQDKSRILGVLALIIIAAFDHLLLTSYIGPLLIALALHESSVKV